MAIVPAYLGEVTHVMKDGRRRRFKPLGPVYFCEGSKVLEGEEKKRATKRQFTAEAVTRRSGSDLAARFMVGLNVGDTPTWTVENVVDVVGKYHRGAASFVAQRGIYVDLSGHRVDEGSVQIIVFADTNDEADFFAKMTGLGEKLREDLKQEAIILEMQKKGIVQGVYDITGES